MIFRSVIKSLGQEVDLSQDLNDCHSCTQNSNRLEREGITQ
jgi:hypothetical protein